MLDYNVYLFKFMLQELIQNADDAQATKVGFTIDWRHHSTDDVMFDNFEKQQGPALYSCMEQCSCVQEKRLAKIDDSNKRDNVSMQGLKIWTRISVCFSYYNRYNKIIDEESYRYSPSLLIESTDSMMILTHITAFSTHVTR